MTEVEWLTATDPTPLLRTCPAQSGPPTERKLRLFAIACCLRIKAILIDGRSANAVKVAEDFLEGRATDIQRKEALESVEKAYLESDDPEYWESPLPLARFAASKPAYEDTTGVGITLLFAATGGADSAAGASGVPAVEKAVQADLCRDIFGNPFRQVTINPSWLTSTVLALATGIYEEKAFDRMPILADALQDAGCDSEDILNHCRQPGEHVRGCWALDFLLGKS